MSSASSQAIGCELAGALRPDAAQRLGQTVLVMDALGVARDLRADDAGRVALIARAVDAADARAVDHLDVERADGRAVVRTDRGTSHDVEGRVHGDLSFAPTVQKQSPSRKGRPAALCPLAIAYASYRERASRRGDRRGASNLAPVSSLGASGRPSAE